MRELVEAASVFGRNVGVLDQIGSWCECHGHPVVVSKTMPPACSGVHQYKLCVHNLPTQCVSPSRGCEHFIAGQPVSACDNASLLVPSVVIELGVEDKC